MVVGEQILDVIGVIGRHSGSVTLPLTKNYCMSAK